MWRLQGVCLERPPRKVSFVKAFNNTEEEVDEKCACGGQKKNNEKGRRQKLRLRIIMEKQKKVRQEDEYKQD